MRKELIAALKKAFPEVHKAQGKKLDKMTDEEVLNLLLNSIQAEVERLAGLEISLKKSQANLSEGEAKLKEGQDQLAENHHELSNNVLLLARDRTDFDEEKNHLASEVERLGGLAVVQPAGGEFDPLWLKELKYRSSEKRKAGKDNGGRKHVFVPNERALRQEDILSWKRYDDHVAISAADGQKHKIDL